MAMTAAQAKLAVVLLQSALDETTAECGKLKTSNAELLDALRAIRPYLQAGEALIADAAIAKA